MSLILPTVDAATPAEFPQSRGNGEYFNIEYTPVLSARQRPKTG